MKIYCIFSDERVYHLKSPAIFSTVLKRMGIKGNYVPFKVNPQDIGKAIQSLKVLHIAGANVTVPYKEVVVPHMNILSEGANIIGAVNTIVCKEDTLKGYNTNAIGFMDTLFQEGISMEGKSALVVGTGGAAKAVIFILNWLRSEMIYVSGR
jgi:shikimate dehydrogenase